MGYSLCMMAVFLKRSYFSNFKCSFDRAIFFTEQLYMICRILLNVFFGILNFDPR